MDRKKFRNWVDFLTCQLHPFTPFSMFGKNQTRSWRIVYQNTGWLSCMVANLSLSNSASNLVFVSYIVHICVWFQLKKKWFDPIEQYHSTAWNRMNGKKPWNYFFSGNHFDHFSRKVLFLVNTPTRRGCRDCLSQRVSTTS